MSEQFDLNKITRNGVYRVDQVTGLPKTQSRYQMVWFMEYKYSEKITIQEALFHDSESMTLEQYQRYSTYGVFGDWQLSLASPKAGVPLVV